MDRDHLKREIVRKALQRGVWLTDAADIDLCAELVAGGYAAWVGHRDAIRLTDKPFSLTEPRG